MQTQNIPLLAFVTRIICSHRCRRENVPVQFPLTRLKCVLDVHQQNRRGVGHMDLYIVYSPRGRSRRTASVCQLASRGRRDEKCTWGVSEAASALMRRPTGSCCWCSGMRLGWERHRRLYPRLRYSWHSWNTGRDRIVGHHNTDWLLGTAPRPHTHSWPLGHLRRHSATFGYPLTFGARRPFNMDQKLTYIYDLIILLRYGNYDHTKHKYIYSYYNLIY